MPVCSERMRKYFDGISGATNTAYAVAQQARSECLDPAADVEIFLASDVAARVEGLVGPRGVAQRIRELLREKKREEVVFEIAREIVEKKFADATLMANGIEPTPEELVEQAIRTGLALYTEGVVSAPIEGISKARIRKNPDGSRYLAIYFAGPIRGAGGTGQAMTLVIGDFCRRLVGIENYRPTGDETDRFIEEVNMYSMRTRAGQYTPTEDEVRHVVTNCPVCIDGEPTEDYEIAVKRNLPNVETNKVRGGVCLVMGEGVCLKAAKILQITKRAKLDWNWLEKLIKVAKKSEARVEIKPVEKFIDEIVGGRPVFSYPMRDGGFRLRYGRSRFMGIQSKGTHPATMTILDDFPAFGTQLKTERPGKGCIITPCRDVDGPVVLLNDGSLLRVESVEEALAVRPHVKEIIFLGDLLVAVGDFIQSNHPLVPSAWCEEWLAAELEAKGVKGATKDATKDVSKTRQELKKISFKEARELCAKHGVALAPRYTFHWHDLTVAELNALASWLCEAKLEYEWFDFKKARIPLSSLGVQTPEARAAKRSLEFLCVPHRVENDEVVIERDWALALFETLSLIEGKRADKTKFDAVLAEFREKNESANAIASEKSEKFDKTDKTDERNALELVKLLAPFEVRAKAPLYVGTSMGRPEKSRERQMKPPVNVLYPIAQHGGKTRDIARAVSDLKRDNKTLIDVETAVRACTECGKRARGAKCECGGATREARACSSCGKTFAVESKEAKAQRCGCGGRLEAFEKRGVNVVKEFEDAERRAQFKPRQLKGVIGLISLDKTAEPLEKGILRAKHDLSVFRDGTIRVDATEIPVTHFVPAEIGLTVEKVKDLGYEKDWKGAPIENAEQTLELLPQDVILSKNAGDYFTRVAAFVDDLLIYFYGLQPFYKAQRREDLIGALGICLAPHTSAGIVTRIIGFNDVHGLQAHPYIHCACRRNADGDELGIMLFLDATLNFSRHYLPATRGGQMDACLVLTTVLEPKEVDNEVHRLEACSAYPLSFYEATLRFASPGEVVKDIDLIENRLGKPSQYEGMGFTHEARIEGPTRSRYVLFKNMRQKVDDELALMTKIRAVDASNACERLVLNHFFPDLYGNLRKFSRQRFRCVKCNAKYRRPPLSGKCTKPNCGDKLLLTISKGSIEKYLQLSMDLAEKYNLPVYLKQRLMLLEKEIDEMFEDEDKKQFSLANYL